MHLVLIGPTGCGKTALSEILIDDQLKRGNVPPAHISSGAIARELSRSDTSTDLALQQGSLAPEAAMRQAVRGQIEAADIQHGGWILDGFPRTVPQLICIQQWTAVMPTFVLLDVPTWVCIERLTQRHRKDDNPDAIARKLELYEQLTQPMIDILEAGGVLHPIQGNGHSVEALAAEVEKALG